MRAAIVSLIGAGLLASATPAKAGISVDLDFHSGPPARSYPGCETVPDRVWVPPVKQCVTQTVWHEPVTEDRVDRVWVPDRFVDREVPGRDSRGRRVTICERVLVQPAHWEDCRKTVVVRAGYYGPETTEVIVQPGYWAPVASAVEPRVDDRVRVRYDDRDDRRHNWRDHDRDNRPYDRR